MWWKCNSRCERVVTDGSALGVVSCVGRPGGQPASQRSECVASTSIARSAHTGKEELVYFRPLLIYFVCLFVCTSVANRLLEPYVFLFFLFVCLFVFLNLRASFFQLSLFWDRFLNCVIIDKHTFKGHFLIVITITSINVFILLRVANLTLI